MAKNVTFCFEGGIVLYLLLQKLTKSRALIQT